MQLNLNKKEISELTKDIYFIEEIWTEIKDVYQLLTLEEILESKRVSKKELMDMENKLEEFKKHYKFYIRNNLSNYREEEIVRIEKYNKYISNLHSEIYKAIEQIC